MSTSITQDMAYRQSLDEIHGEIRREPRQPEVQQEPVVHLLLESPLGWDGAVPGLPVQAAPRPPQSTHRSGTEADPGYASPQSGPGHGGAVASAAAERHTRRPESLFRVMWKPGCFLPRRRRMRTNPSPTSR